ncbi:unnamed protein product [Somion occarium]|uniref:SET domain-containing protein n=1 Tax=Somion occarium TaxID=3059160 RepID=A0ABP1CMJ2_9APHY
MALHKGRQKEHPSGWTVLEPTPSDPAASPTSASSEDMRDEIMDPGKQTRIEDYIPSLSVSPDKKKKRKALTSPSTSPLVESHKRNRVEYAKGRGNDLGNEALSLPSQSQSNSSAKPPTSASINSSAVKSAGVPRPTGSAKHPYANPSLSKTTNTGTTSPSVTFQSTSHATHTPNSSTSTHPPDQPRPPMARKSTGGRRAALALRAAAGVDVTRARPASMGGRERIGKEKPYAEVSKSDGGEGSGSVKPHIGLKEATRVVKRGAGAATSSAASKSITKEGGKRPLPPEANLDSDLPPKPKSQSFTAALMALVDSKSPIGKEIIVISSDSESEAEAASELYKQHPTRRSRSESGSPHTSTSRARRSASSSTSRTRSRARSISHTRKQSGNIDEPIVISDSEDDVEDSERVQRPISPTPEFEFSGDIPSPVSSCDSNNVQDMNVGDAEAFMRNLSDDSLLLASPDSERATTPRIRVSPTNITNPSTVWSSSSMSRNRSPSSLKRKVTMVGTLFGGQDGFFRNVHTKSQPTRSSKDVSRSSTLSSSRRTTRPPSGDASRHSPEIILTGSADETDPAESERHHLEIPKVVVAELHAEVSHMSSQLKTKAIRDLLTPIREKSMSASSGTQSLSDIINSAALSNARPSVSVGSKKPSPSWTDSLSHSPALDEEEMEVLSMIEGTDEEEEPPFMPSTMIERARKFRRSLSLSSTSRSSQQSSRSNSVSKAASPPPTRPPRPRRNTSQKMTKQFAISRLGLQIKGSEVEILLYGGRHPAKEFASLQVAAHKLPHTVANYIKELSLTRRVTPRNRQDIFADVIQANTRDDEPDAPRISIINTIDPEVEPIPAFQYHYSNLMVHHEHIPQPRCQPDMLQHCNCAGACKPRSCPCAAWQMKWLPKQAKSGFIYDSDRRLHPGMYAYPIFECNMYCGCNDECQNRVVQLGRSVGVKVNIQKTAKKGWGIFAACGDEYIPANTFIGVYAGEYITVHEAEKRESIYNKSGRTYLFDVDFDFDEGPDEIEKAASYCIDAFYTGNFTRYLNHSCDPNCVITACFINESNLDKPLLTIFSIQDILDGEELCLSYFGSHAALGANDTPPHGSIHVSCECGSARCIGRIWK